MAADPQKQVLGAILAGRQDLLSHAMLHVSEEHFTSEVTRGLWQMLTRYWEIAGGILPLETLSDLMDRGGWDASKSLLFEETYKSVSQSPVKDHEYRYAIDSLKDRRAQQLTGEAITTTFEILERGSEVGRDYLKGHQEARTYAYQRFAEIDKLDNREIAPEGDIRNEANEIMAEYQTQKEGKAHAGVMCGIHSIDSHTGGFQRGELVLVAAYAGGGKTQFCCQTAWHAAVGQGENVFFATSETVRPTVRRRIVARHSRLPQFGLPNGLDSTKIKKGTLSKDEEKILQEVVEDLSTNPAYGKIYIAQIPRGATLPYVEARANRQAAEWDVGLIVMDYLALFKSESNRATEREAFNEILRSAKVYAASFAEGRGVPFISPWQIRREAYNEASRHGLYSLNSLADTAEAERSSDQILSLYQSESDLDRRSTSLQFLKMRDGELPRPRDLHVDYRNAYLGEAPSGAAPGPAAWQHALEKGQLAAVPSTGFNTA